MDWVVGATKHAVDNIHSNERLQWVMDLAVGATGALLSCTLLKITLQWVMDLAVGATQNWALRAPMTGVLQ